MKEGRREPRRNIYRDATLLRARITLLSSILSTRLLSQPSYSWIKSKTEEKLGRWCKFRTKKDADRNANGSFHSRPGSLDFTARIESIPFSDKASIGHRDSSSIYAYALAKFPLNFRPLLRTSARYATAGVTILFIIHFLASEKVGGSIQHKSN